jgi:hypothetical protein
MSTFPAICTAPEASQMTGAGFIAPDSLTVTPLGMVMVVKLYTG